MSSPKAAPPPPECPKKSREAAQRRQQYKHQQRKTAPRAPPKVANIIAKNAAIKRLIRAAKKAPDTDGITWGRGVDAWDRLYNAVRDWEKLTARVKRRK